MLNVPLEAIVRGLFVFYLFARGMRNILPQLLPFRVSNYLYPNCYTPIYTQVAFPFYGQIFLFCAIVACFFSKWLCLNISGLEEVKTELKEIHLIVVLIANCIGLG